jgi:hypothetical protein
MRSKMVYGGLLSVGFALAPAVGCSSTTTSEGLSDDDAQTLVDLFVADARASSRSASSSLRAQSIGVGQADLGGRLHVLANCTPTQLTPPTPCAAGGNIYTTIDQSCTMPTGCCAAQSPCAADHAAVNGLGKFYYNACRPSSRVTVDGSINWTEVMTLDVPCNGAATGTLKITWNGLPSMKVDGREVCDGTIFVTATLHIGATISGTLTGSICGHQVSRGLNFGCVVDCGGGACCGAGSYCSKCGGGCFSSAYPNECCDGSNKACPAGLRCVGGGKCGP